MVPQVRVVTMIIETPYHLWWAPFSIIYLDLIHRTVGWVTAVSYFVKRVEDGPTYMGWLRKRGAIVKVN